MISNFEKALKRDELPDYFRGIGIYFTRDPEWGTQLHVLNWQGLCGFLKMQEHPEGILKNAFIKYVITVTNHVEDASDLLENTGCYYNMREKTPELSANGFDLVRDLPVKAKQTLSEAIKYLNNELTRSNNKQVIDLYNRTIEKLIKDAPQEILRDLSIEKIQVNH